MLYYLISNLKDICITIYIFKLYLIPGVQIPTKNSGSHVDPSDVHLIRLTWLLPIKKLNMVYYKDNDVIILRIGLNVHEALSLRNGTATGYQYKCERVGAGGGGSRC